MNGSDEQEFELGARILILNVCGPPLSHAWIVPVAILLVFTIIFQFPSEYPALEGLDADGECIKS
jgi:hypothetical protein